MNSDTETPAAGARRIPVATHVVQRFEQQPSRWPLFLHRSPAELAVPASFHPVRTRPETRHGR